MGLGNFLDKAGGYFLGGAVVFIRGVGLLDSHDLFFIGSF